MRLLLLILLLIFLPACRFLSEAESATYGIRNARDTIRNVKSQRDSAALLVPIQDHIEKTLATFPGVAACECVLTPVTESTQTVHDDHSVTYSEKQSLELYLVLTLNSPENWNVLRIQSEVAGLLHDANLNDFTLSRPIHATDTWYVHGSGPIPTTAEKIPTPHAFTPAGGSSG